jgi:hypothetical protein
MLLIYGMSNRTPRILLLFAKLVQLGANFSSVILCAAQLLKCLALDT